MRSGTLDVAGITAFAVAVEMAVKSQPEYVARVGALRDDLIARRTGAGAGGGAQRRSGDRLPGNAHFSFPGCEGDALLLLLDAQGSPAPPGSACSAGVAQPPTCSSRWARTRTRPASRFGSPSGHTSTVDEIESVAAALPGALRAGSRGPARSRPAATTEGRTGEGARRHVRRGGLGGGRGPGGRRRTRRHRRAPRACRATRRPYRSGARGCCTLEDSRDARRAADVIGIPFYVWDMAEEFHARW